MPAVMTGYAESGLTTAKFVRRRLADGNYWSTVAVAFEAWSTGHVANYGIAATEDGATGVYTASDPDPATPGDYLLVKAAGSSLAVGDFTTGVRWQDSAGPQQTGDAYAYVVTNMGILGANLSAVPKTGYKLASDGLDSITVESGMNARQSFSIIAAAIGGVLSGAGTTTITIKGAGVATTRVVATCDSDGNRSSVTLTLPS